jgi:hypothetical protein
VRIEAARIMCEAEANIYKLVNEGPTFKTSIKLPHSYNQESNNNKLTL